MFTKISIPQGVEAKKEGSVLFVKGLKGELNRDFDYPRIDFKIDGKELIFSSEIKGKRGKMMVNTFASHAKNMMIGVTEGYVYKLKIVFSHFPINVKINGIDVVVENFFGEKKPRKTKIFEGVEAKVEGDEIIVTGVDKEKTAQSAANIELVSKRSGYDKRRFQDGIYIFEKAGNPV